MAITAAGGYSKLYKAMKFAVKNFFEHRVDFSKSVSNCCYFEETARL
jgi:hypothetical protein